MCIHDPCASMITVASEKFGLSKVAKQRLNKGACNAGILWMQNIGHSFADQGAQAGWKTGDLSFIPQKIHWFMPCDTSMPRVSHMVYLISKKINDFHHTSMSRDKGVAKSASSTRDLGTTELSWKRLKNGNIAVHLGSEVFVFKPFNVIQHIQPFLIRMNSINIPNEYMPWWNHVAEWKHWSILVRNPLPQFAVHRFKSGYSLHPTGSRTPLTLTVSVEA